MDLTKLIGETKAKLVEAFTPLVDTEDPAKLDMVLPYEPTAAPTTPLLTMIYAGHSRAGLERPEVEGPRITDPIGGRIWVLKFDVRLWVDLVGDEKLAQERTDGLVLAVVGALEEDKSLGAFAVDSAMPSGGTAIMQPTQGQALLIHTFKCSVEIEERL